RRRAGVSEQLRSRFSLFLSLSLFRSLSLGGSRYQTSDGVISPPASVSISASSDELPIARSSAHASLWMFGLVRARLKSHLSRARKGRRASMPIEPPGRPWCGLCPRGSSAGALLEQLRGDLLGEVRAEVGRQLQGEGLARLRREVAE
ncbi:unnamed protein product, partial [Prorocentrum cordatum]